MPEPIQHADLGRLAVAAAENSYSPYSKFRVGCAVRTADGTIIQGCNVENASYGLTICAERAALFAAIAAGHRNIPALAVACPDIDPEAAQEIPSYVMPCGACRQVMAELLAPDAWIEVVNVGIFTLDDMLPRAFSLLHIDGEGA